jgi:hypothetical protein
MIPRWREVSRIISTYLAMIEAPPPQRLNTLFPAVDWVKFSSGLLTFHFFDMCALADAWTSIERRWIEEDYSVAISHSTLHVSFPQWLMH